jgi:hypothetical protein
VTVFSGRSEIAVYAVMAVVFVALTVVFWMLSGVRTGVFWAAATVGLVWKLVTLLRARAKARDSGDQGPHPPSK